MKPHLFVQGLMGASPEGISSSPHYLSFYLLIVPYCVLTMLMYRWTYICGQTYKCFSCLAIPGILLSMDIKIRFIRPCGEHLRLPRCLWFRTMTFWFISNSNPSRCDSFRLKSYPGIIALIREAVNLGDITELTFCPIFFPGSVQVLLRGGPGILEFWLMA